MEFDPPFPFNLVTSQFQESARHCECRRCGRNLPPSTETCPGCGGQAVVYDW